MKNLDIKIFTQLLLEPIPVSSSTQIQIISLWTDKTLLTIKESLLIQQYNIFTDILAFCWFFFNNKKHKLSKDVFINFIRLFMLAFVANIFTTIFFIIQKIIPVSIENWQHKAFFGSLVSLFLILSNFIKEKYYQTNNHNAQKTITSKLAIILGIGQGLATLPGISRLGTTVVVARWLNINPKDAFFFSWMLHAQISLGYCTHLFFSNKFSNLYPMQASTNIFITLLGFVLSIPLFHLCYKLIMKNKFYLFFIFQLLTLFQLTTFFWH